MSSREGSPALDDKRPDVVDPIVRGHIYSLCTALGGGSSDKGGKYMLGDDALGVLKDLRRWLKLYDEKLNRYDVARCLSEMNLVKGDLLEILAIWKDSETMIKHKHRTVLACIEILTPLTWPLEKQNEQMTMNHHRHIPVLEYAQLSYKKAILQHRSGKILKDIVRVALPSIALPLEARTERDDGIIRLVLYALRNIVVIENLNPHEMDTGEDVDRSATIHAFSDQNVFHLMLTVASGIGDEFKSQDGVLMEILYHLVKGVDVESIFRNDEEENRKKAQDLSSLLKMEDDSKRENVRLATRHNRFGTSVWVEKEDGSRAFVPGQQAMLDKNKVLEKMDETKKWKRPRGGDRKGVSLKTEFDMRVPLEDAARRQLREFVENFIDSGFNPLFYAIRRGLERDIDRLMNTSAKQYFYTVAWFLKAERIRRNAAKRAKNKQAVNLETDSFGVVAAAMEQEFLITLTKRMSEWFEMKSWRELQAGMRCFTQIMYTVQDMTLSPIEEDQEIAENIQNRLFYEETSMILICDILRSYTRQSFGWLNDCTEMIHVHLRLLEKYSTQHQHMFIRSRRRQTKKRKEKIAEQGPDDYDDEGEPEIVRDENDEELAEASKRAVAERSFDFSKFEARFLNPKCIDTFVIFLGFYKELSPDQIMRAIKFLHRIYEKRKEEIVLYRLDIVDLFYRMMRGSDSLHRSHAVYKEVDGFVKYYLRKLFKKLEKEPALFVELLFTKQNSTIYRLQHGEDKEVRVTQPREAAELKVKDGMDNDGQIGVAIGALLNENKSNMVEWLKDVFKRATTERRSWEDEAEARRLLDEETQDPEALEAPEDQPPAEKPKPEAPIIVINTDNEEFKLAMFKDSKLRLLLKLLGCEKANANETSETKWIIPSGLTSRELQDALRLLQKHSDDPPVYEDGMTAEDFLARAQAPRPAKKRADAMSSDEEDGDTDVEALFPPNHTYEKNDSGNPKKKKLPGPRKRRRGEKTNEELEAKRLAKEQKEKEKLSKIKSALYIEDSDDNSEDDAAFFEKERQIRERGPTTIDQSSNMMNTGTKKRRKKADMRRADEDQVPEFVSDDENSDTAVMSDEDDDEGDISMRTKTINIRVDDSDDMAPAPTSSAKAKSKPTVVDGDDDDSDDDLAPALTSSAKAKSKPTVVGDDDEDDDDEDVLVPIVRRKRAVAVESDSE